MHNDLIWEADIIKEIKSIDELKVSDIVNITTDDDKIIFYLRILDVNINFVKARGLMELDEEGERKFNGVFVLLSNPEFGGKFLLKKENGEEIVFSKKCYKMNTEEFAARLL